MQKNMIITLLFSILIAFFAILNAAAIPVNLIFMKMDISAALVILLSASIGAVIVYSLDTVSKMKSRKRCKEFEKNNAMMNKEIKELQEKSTSQLLEIENLKMKIEKLKKGDQEDAIKKI
ncbi:LapA family protein [Fusibacter tunisiensis]|uniref:Integral membrane protein n=1 Tax=Fusibacter tunisiensis TaxID=1008308 RepID=A0ABS2MUH0_9FIRM|nr:LapA family protein [Fusibacter tunisiensis]MBM7563000.1 putative integral membrane protein [Fusibacter tunisiensis]